MPYFKQKDKIQAIISMAQLAKIKALFIANNAVFHIKDETSDFIWLYFYGLSRNAQFLVTGWDNADDSNNKSHFFDDIYNAMEKALSNRKQLPLVPVDNTSLFRY